MFYTLRGSLLIILVLFFSAPFQVHASDFPKSVSLDLAKQCFKNMKEYADDTYGRVLNSRYSYFPAEKENEDHSPNVAASIKIEVKDNYDDENWAICEFNSKAQVLCFTDPFDLSNPTLNGKKLQSTVCWSEPRRFR